MASQNYDAGAMPTNYDSDVNQGSSSVIDKEWLTSINGILKMAQILTSLLVLICSTAWASFAAHYGGHWVQFSCIIALLYVPLSFYTNIFHIKEKLVMIGLQVNFTVVSVICIICSSIDFADKYGGGWVEFVSITAAIMITVRFCMYLFHLPSKLSPKMPFYFVELVIYSILTLFYFISAIVCSVFGHHSASIGAAAFFTWVATALHGGDVYFALGKWRGSGEGPNFTRTGTNPSSSTQGGAVSMPTDPYVSNPSNVQPSNVEKGLPPQY